MRDSGSAQETPGNAPESNPRLAEPEVDPATLRRDRILFLQCRACHSTKQGEEHKVGLNLYDFLGAKAASKPDYAYSESLVQSGVVWSSENPGHNALLSDYENTVPPLMSKLAPVMKLASEDARYATKSATSEACPSRRKGVPAATLARTASLVN